MQYELENTSTGTSTGGYILGTPSFTLTGFAFVVGNRLRFRVRADNAAGDVHSEWSAWSSTTAVAG